MFSLQVCWSSSPGAATLSRLLTGDVGALLALLAIVAIFSIADRIWGEGYFATVRNFRVVVTQTSIVAVAALGMTLIIIAGGIDLSAGTALTLSATVMAFYLRENYPVVLTVIATLGTGCLCGLPTVSCGLATAPVARSSACTSSPKRPYGGPTINGCEVGEGHG